MTSRKEEHHGLVSRAVTEEENALSTRNGVIQPPYPRKDAVLLLLHNGLTREQAAKTVGVSRATVQRYVAAFRQGGLDGLRSGISRPVSEMAAYRELIRAREATSHDHRRGVRTHLSMGRRPSQVRKFLKDLA